MLKTLLKKQLLETFHTMFVRSAAGKKGKGKGSVVLFSLLMVYAYGVIGWLFFTMSRALCQPLCEMGKGWLYFALMGTMATTMGIIGSVFSTYSSLYKAKDNEMLLSMPVKPGMILLARMSGCYVMSLFFESLVLIPVFIAYVMEAGFSVGTMVCAIVILPVLPVFALAISCVLGWVIAQAASRVTKGKSFITLALSLGFFALYYYVVMQASRYLQLILINSEELAGTIKTFLYPIYQMGLAAEGSFSSLLIFTFITAAVFGAVYLVLSRSFLKLATVNKAAKKTVYNKVMTDAVSPRGALLKKEFLRLKSSSAYMLNCGMGTLMMLVAAVVLVVKGGTLLEMRESLQGLIVFDGTVLLVGSALAAFLISMNDFTAASVSLEGKNLWLLQSSPVDPWYVLEAKANMHLILTAVPAVVCCVLLAVFTWLNISAVVSLLIFALVYSDFTAFAGLAINLKMPNLNWTNEAVAVKQGISVLIAIFGSWGIIAIFVGMYFLFGQNIEPSVFVGICSVLLAAATVLIRHWIKTRGIKLFARL